ncbi:MAG: CDF family Co(II)/Ni(II) efflux transporter DmeF [Polyangiales bacterium]
MHAHEIEKWQHSHVFGTDERHAGERRTRWVIALTVCMMVGEVVAGLMFKSMALLADGWHMATHAVALAVAAFAYWFMRRRALDRSFSFGTGKVGALGGFGSAVALAVVALLVLAESIARLTAPQAIRYDEAIGVAVLGLVVNLLSVLLLHDGGHHHHGHAHDAHDAHDTHDAHDSHHHEHEHHHHDHNLRGAYLHVLADAFTSVLAIGALLLGKYFGWSFVDALVGILGAVVIARWSLGLLRDTSAVLLDSEVPEARRRAVQAALEADADNKVADLHLWRVGPRHLAAIVSVVTHAPREPGHYKRLLAEFEDLRHVTVEVNHCAEHV